MSIPPLPRSHGRSPNINVAFRRLNDSYQGCQRFLHGGRGDLARILHHANVIVDDIFPILHAMEKVASDENIPLTWLEEVASKFANLLLELVEAEADAKGE